MSYDICLYEEAFLKRAFEQNLGDWTNADPISEEKKSRIRQLLVTKGYKGGSGRVEEYFHPNENWAITVSIYTGEIAITIPYWKDADKAIEAALTDAQDLANASQLMLYDPQTGGSNEDERDDLEDEEEI
jgi:hypothetical protein